MGWGRGGGGKDREGRTGVSSGADHSGRKASDCNGIGVKAAAEPRGKKKTKNTCTD